MSKIITIPTTMNPFIVTVNGVPHKYPAGATMEVPDNVAAIVEQYEKGNFPKPVMPATEINMTSPGGARCVVTVSDSGELVVRKIFGAMFTFKVGGTVYTAEEGMTWGDWLESEYAPVDSCYECNGEMCKYRIVDGNCVGVYETCAECGNDVRIPFQ